MKRTIGVAVLTVSTLFSGTAIAQDAPEHSFVIAQAGAPGAGPVVVMHSQVVGGDPGDVFVQNTNGPAVPMITVGGTEFLFEGKPVKGAPFSADAVTETVQQLADGNRITNSSATKLYRDSEGRTRRELSQDAQAMTVMPFPGPTMSHPEVTISDPVAGVNYMLNTKSRTAMKLPLPQHVQKMKIANGPAHAQAGSATSADPLPQPGARERQAGVVAFSTSGSVAFSTSDNNMIFRTHTAGDIKTDSLGTQTIEGVEAQGKRVTETIPAGQIGNEQPIISTTETWYSPRLQRLVLSKRHDPRFGDTTFKLTNISLAEPSPSLFQVPSDYKITDPKAEAERLKKELERMKPEFEKMRKDFERQKPEFEKMQKEFQRQKPELDRLRNQLLETVPNHTR